MKAEDDASHPARCWWAVENRAAIKEEEHWSEQKEEVQGWTLHGYSAWEKVGALEKVMLKGQTFQSNRASSVDPASYSMGKLNDTVANILHIGLLFIYFVANVDIEWLAQVSIASHLFCDATFYGCDDFLHVFRLIWSHRDNSLTSF